MAKPLKSIHQGLLISVAIALGIVTCKSLFFPATPQPSVSAIKTDLKKLAQWESLSHNSLQKQEVAAVVSGEFQGGITQTWQREAETLSLQEAIFSKSDGDLKTYLKTYSNDLTSVLKHHPELGYYALFFQGDRLTMTGCLTAAQGATVTADQFKVAQIKASLRPAQFWLWLSNQEQLIPHTCHWRSLSISPVTPTSTATLLELWQDLN